MKKEARTSTPDQGRSPTSVLAAKMTEQVGNPGTPAYEAVPTYTHTHRAVTSLIFDIHTGPGAEPGMGGRQIWICSRGVRRCPTANPGWIVSREWRVR